MKRKGKEYIVQQTYSTVPFITRVTVINPIKLHLFYNFTTSGFLSLMTLWKRGWRELN